ncbi:hypothetical protein RJ639_028983 [Escallonia herrerae]|uniref:EGF-like domain-containing protein n=1 Tax=Escallonia herrerae TaxID=1293975 RepID=A0AA88X649_9ASTE|nr:hypothetical protein RJ639_028983 [Escallonia herrerae]
MASSAYATGLLAVLLVLRAWTATSNILPPILSPFFGTLNYSCKEGPSPVQEKDKRANESFFEPCHWADCGGGTCNKTSAFIHRCDCSEGYYNLLNMTAFPCFRECKNTNLML